MRKVIAALMLTSACFTPAFAQTKTPVGQVDAKADCQSNFKAADKNGNGTLSRAEIDASTRVMPTSLGSKDSVSKSQFMLACEGNRPKGG